MTTQLIHLEAADVSVVLGVADASCMVLHWGARLPQIGSLDDFLEVTSDGESWADVDDSRNPGLWREAARGFMGEPVVRGHRTGTDWSPLFKVASIDHSGNCVIVDGRDDDAGLAIHSVITLHPSGMLTIAHTLTNTGVGEYTVDAVTTYLPLPDRVAEVLDFTGRWVKERQPQRQDIRVGTWTRTSREGRSGHDETIVEIAMTKGTDFRSGEAWSTGVQWSGNTRYCLERLAVGRTSMGGGEHLLPGEVRLGAGESYEAPAVAFAYSSSGLDGLTRSHLEWLRSRPEHPTNIRPRPLTLNVWEAVWFDHDLDRLTALMDVAQEIGVERFVLDDGWFHLRRDDYAGLGDWWVDPDVWPQGLGELIARVKARGMEFGLWFEPEMVNVNSDLFREHPDWILQVGDRMPPEKRHQQVLNIAHPDAWAYIFGCIDALLTEYDISYIKWDHNRALVDPAWHGVAAVRQQAEAFYRLVRELKKAHPGLEIESCASGGGRIDLGAAHVCDRFWTSDCNEALERQQIQRWTGMAIPPELLGTHIGPPRSHSTGRTHDLAFRAVTALFGHAGIEWDITQASSVERAALRQWADYYKDHRELLHHGDVVRVDGIDESALVHGVVSRDRSTGLFAYIQLTAAQASKPDNFLLAGLDPNSDYLVRMAQPAGIAPALETRQPTWAEGKVLSGTYLASIGLRPPRLMPETGFLIEVSRT